MSQRERIKVVCRIRPENKLEKEGNYSKCVTFEDYAITVTVSRPHSYECPVHTGEQGERHGRNTQFLL